MQRSAWNWEVAVILPCPGVAREAKGRRWSAWIWVILSFCGVAREAGRTGAVEDGEEPKYSPSLDGHGSCEEEGEGET
jgi:hypothetical protein